VNGYAEGRQLRAFTVGSGSKITRKGIDWLAKNRGLRHLDLSDGEVIDRDLMNLLGELPALEGLGLTSCRGDLDALREFPVMRSLTFLSLAGVSLKDGQFPDLARVCPNLSERFGPGLRPKRLQPRPSQTEKGDGPGQT